jgi:tRNA(fMet)-specific endonuclease VapC
MGVLIDTSVVVGVERQGGSIDELLLRLHDDEVAISAITASELIMGILRAKPEGRRAAREDFVEYVIGLIPTLPVDLPVARVHARVRAELTASGQLIGPHDLLIAATALAHDYELLTDNVREFEHVSGLQVRAHT